MSKTSSKRRSKRRQSRREGQTDRSVSTDVVTQLECAAKNPHAALIGALLGGLVPWFGRTLAHDQVPAAWSAANAPLVGVLLAVVVGCAVFSAISVYKFGRAAFGDSRKALGFVLALEGVMLVSTGATSNVALAVLVLINAVANGSVIALARDATRRRCEADARRSATRARNRPVARDVGAPDRGPKRAATASAAGDSAVASWRLPAFDDAVDAEIVGEEKLLLS